MSSDVVLAELGLGSARVRAVRTCPSEQMRKALIAGGNAVGVEIIEVRWGQDTFGQPVLSERPSEIGIDAHYLFAFGLLPAGAVSVEAVAPDGARVACTVGAGVWLVVLPADPRGIPPSTVLFSDQDGSPVNPGLPDDWEREEIGAREVSCPACGSDDWDLVTAALEGEGHLRSTRWGHGVGPGQAYVCRKCGHEERHGQRFSY